MALGVARPPRIFTLMLLLASERGARRLDLRRAIAARDFVEGLREAGAMSRENSSRVSTRLRHYLAARRLGKRQLWLAYTRKARRQ